MSACADVTGSLQVLGIILVMFAGLNGKIKESGIWKHRRRSPAVWTAAKPEDDLIPAKTLSAKRLATRQMTNLALTGFVSRPRLSAQRYTF